MTEDPLQPSHRAELRWKQAEQLLGLSIVLLAGFFLLLFLYAAAKRIRYPFELEWIESGVLTGILRIVHGQGLYVAPSLHFVPYLYAPLYMYVVAAITRLTGLGADSYTAMRLVSIVSSLGAVGLVFTFIQTETSHRIAAIAGAGLYLASYVLLGNFFDIGRVDALFVFFLLLALLLQRRGYPMFAALTWVLAFQTKQTVLPLAVLVLLANWRRPKLVASSVLVFLGCTAVSILAMNHLTSGWYVFYVFRVTQGLQVVWRLVALYWPSVVLQPLQIAWVIIVAAALFTRISWRSTAASFYLFVSFALFGGIWFVESHRGASANAAMPIVAWTTILFGVALGRLLGRKQVASPSAEANATVPFTWNTLVRVLVLTAAAAQLFALVYNPGGYVPAPAARLAGEKLIGQIRHLPGEVYVLNHSHDAVLAGKQPYAEGEALGAVIDAHLGTVSTDLRREFDEQVYAHRYSAIVSDDTQPTGTSWKVDPFYPIAVAAPARGEHYLTSQPEWFLLPCTATSQVYSPLLHSTDVISRSACATPPAQLPGQ